MRCDIIAKGIISAASELDLKVPIVVRLQGKFARIKVVKDGIKGHFELRLSLS